MLWRWMSPFLAWMMKIELCAALFSSGKQWENQCCW